MSSQLRSKDPAQRGTDSALERVKSLKNLIETSALQNEDATQIADDVVEALRDANILSIMVPRELGGEEARPDVLIDVIRELSYYDGSTGWYAGAVMTAGAVSGACLGESAIDAIFRGDRIAICAGQAAPTGKAERVGDGYRVSGRFSFGSGTPAASWLVGGYVLHEAGKPVMSGGMPVMLLGFVPRDTVEFHGNWNVLGLRGTGSYDFTVREQILHQDFFFNAGAPQVKRGGALYRMGFMGLPTLTHASFALGCAHRALDEWGNFAKQKSRGSTLANERQTTQRDFAVAHAELRAAEAYVRRTFSRLFEAATAGHIDEDLKMDGRLCASNAVSVGTRVAQAAFTFCTTHALRNGNAIQRCFRDMHAGNAHFLTGEQSLIDAGRVLAGVAGASIVF